MRLRVQLKDCFYVRSTPCFEVHYNGRGDFALNFTTTVLHATYVCKNTHLWVMHNLCGIALELHLETAAAVAFVRRLLPVRRHNRGNLLHAHARACKESGNPETG